jgi:hypothetical protein
MKTMILLTLSFLSLNLIADPAARKVSNSSYYVCQIERDNSLGKSFNRQYIFPYPTSSGETHELKASMRWNNISIVFDNKGSVEAVISERIEGKKVEGTKSLQLDKEPQFESFKMTVDLKAATNVSYSISCRPE